MYGTRPLRRQDSARVSADSGQQPVHREHVAEVRTGGGTYSGIAARPAGMQRHRGMGPALIRKRILTHA